MSIFERLGTSLALLALLLVPAAAQQPEEAAEAPAPAGQEEQSGSDLEREPSDDVFIPTEEIPADEEITFPVDI